MPETAGDGAVDPRRWQVLLGTNRTEQALAEISAQLARDPGDIRAACFAARAYLTLGRHADAERMARQVLAQSPEHEWALRLLAVTLCQSGRKSEAILPAEQCVRAHPTMASSWQCLAQVLLIADRAVAALAVAKRAVELDPDDDDGMLLQAGAYLHLRQRQPAIALIGLVLRRNPDNDEAARALARIDPRGGRWLIGRMTADLVAEQASRESLRGRPPADFTVLTNRLQGDLPRIPVHGKWIDERAVGNALAAAGDPDLPVAVRRIQRRWLLLALAAQVVITFFSRGDRISPEVQQAAATAVILSLALVAVPLLRLVAPGRTLPWRRMELRQLLAPTAVVMLACAVFAGVRAAGLRTDTGSIGLQDALLISLFGLLVGLGSTTNQEMNTFARLMPTGRVLVAAFVLHRRVLSVVLAVAAGLAWGSHQVYREVPELPFWCRLVALVPLVVVVQLAGLGRGPGLGWGDPAVRHSVRLLRRVTMHRLETFVRIGAGLAGVTVLLPTGLVDTGYVLTGIVILLLVVQLWVTGPVSYLPGLNPNARERTTG